MSVSYLKNEEEGAASFFILIRNIRIYQGAKRLPAIRTAGDRLRHPGPAPG